MNACHGALGPQGMSALPVSCAPGPARDEETPAFVSARSYIRIESGKIARGCIGIAA
jgi:hypothetical protein